MKHITKKALTKRAKIIIILGIAFVILLTGAILMATLIETDEGGTTPVTPPEIIEGESIKNNIAIAYPEIKDTSIQLISVRNKISSYDLFRTDEDGLVLQYTDSNGDKQIYYPAICESGSGVEYSSLYAIEQNDGFKQYTKLSYLCLALQLTYFSERIPMAEDATEREAQLESYGLSEKDVQTVKVSYLDEDGKTQSHTVKIGSKLVTGMGFYFTVDDRPYVYSSIDNGFDYALAGFYSLVKATLVAAGLSEDQGQEPYLTTGFYQWMNEKHTAAEDKITEGSKVIAYADVISPINPHKDTSSSVKNSSDGYFKKGYSLLEFDLSEISDTGKHERLIKALVDRGCKVYYDLLDESASPLDQIIFSITSNGESKELSFTEQKPTLTYAYSILRVEAILTEDGEISTAGTTVGAANEVKVSYTFTVDGVATTDLVCHAVLDLTNPIYPTEVINEIRAAEIGKTLTQNCDFEITYTTDNSVKTIAKYVITDIISIYGQDGKEKKTVGEESIVSYRYRVEADGVLSDDEFTVVLDLKKATDERNDNVKAFLLGRKAGKLPYLTVTESDEGDIVTRVIKSITKIVDKDGVIIEMTKDAEGNTVYTKTATDGTVTTLSGAGAYKIDRNSTVTYTYTLEINGEQIGSVHTDTVTMSTLTDAFGLRLFNTLVGRSVANIDTPIAENDVIYYEYLSDFVTYKIARIDYFITSELVVAFKFQNASERDPYYGESIYENLLTDERRLYGLNAGTCETAVKMLGGITQDSASATANGLYGDEALAIGLTPEVMDKYGLYAYTVYFEIPRGIYATVVQGADGTVDPDALDDYGYYDKLGFTLYISEEQTDGTRYVASDLYEVVTKVSADKLVFLKYDFQTFWARRNLILMSVSDIDALNVEFNMEGLRGSYDMELTHRDLWFTGTQGYYSDPGDNVAAELVDQISVSVTPEDINSCTSNKLVEMMKENGYTHMSLTELYGGSNVFEENSYDFLGTSMFKELVRMIFFTRYSGTLTEEEQARILSAGGPLMKMELEISSSAFKYVYEFYRQDDRRVLVRIYQADDAGNVKSTPVSDFYMSTYAFKKLANGFATLLNGEKIDIDESYFKDEE